ncbi:hypothetical protein BFR04_11705 [Gaetbulibacter sp. 4G1]|nr:sugar-transfer associated ATP-grasp domain-containing protein [Gaetbulibacter sp. 4G1]PIA81964.1 hypothetical protein BFR04_11705 [Gaetbulibacter sp. 4G1]
MLPKKKRQILLSFFKDKHKKNWFQIIKEFITLYFTNKSIPLYYITHFLYRKNTSNYKDYLSLKEHEKSLEWSCSFAPDQIILVENKLLFEELLVKNNIPTPKIFFHNSKNKFAYKGSGFEFKNKKELFSFFSKAFNEENVERFFCKPTNGRMGQNIFILDKNTYKNIDDTLVNLIFSQELMFQEVIVQHESLNEINKFSVNTLRIVTYKNEEGKVEILSGFIRLGIKGSVLDNAHAGGIVVSFNKETGKMGQEGLQLIDNGSGVFYKHPDTGIIFDSFQIPCYTQVKKIVIDVARLLKFPLLGWDVAITPDGPVIVEANHDFHLLLSDRMENGLKKNPVFNKLLQEIKRF